MTPLETLDDASQRSICAALGGFVAAGGHEASPAVRRQLTLWLGELAGAPPVEVTDERLTPAARLVLVEWLMVTALEAPEGARHWFASKATELVGEFAALRAAAT